MIKPRKIRLLWYEACMGERRGVYRVLVGKSERATWKIEMKTQEVGWVYGLD
jgi:hypothetical protein